ncbi:DUF1574 family protein [Leptospira sp. GIMC2001]|uniref:DUF1574 family protein n=1 Tax=Leptospira sp. GIMC2001 TaxID=1513297 RepID=UPI00234A34BB|nr:DUF1574 family protein [Leptospira sp. GIMC2001]WCL48054.1 DUF1574 family protein [Leptospira sp. GIMC2001]
MLKNKYLWICLILPLLWFSFDKIFALKFVKDYTIPWKKIEILFYESKSDLFQVLLENLEIHKQNNEKIALVLGSSRSGEFSYKDIKKEFPRTVTYNFSAPLAGPAFHYYWLERIVAAHKNLEFVILEVDPIMFSRNSLTYTLNYSLDAKFVWRHSNFLPIRTSNPWKSESDGFNWDEVETFLNKSLFASYRYPPDINAIRDNRKETFMPIGDTIISVNGMEYKKQFEDSVHEANRTEYGAIPNQIMYHSDPAFLKKDAENMAKIYFGNQFKPSLTQITFFRKILNLLAVNKIPVILYWPVVADPLREEMDNRGLVAEYYEHIHREVQNVRKVHKDFESVFLDPQLSSELKCRAFVDSVHLSGACYPELFSLFGRSFND